METLKFLVSQCDALSEYEVALMTHMVNEQILYLSLVFSSTKCFLWLAGSEILASTVGNLILAASIFSFPCKSPSSPAPNWKFYLPGIWNAKHLTPTLTWWQHKRKQKIKECEPKWDTLDLLFELSFSFKYSRQSLPMSWLPGHVTKLPPPQFG